jgi:tellurite resistance protein
LNDQLDFVRARAAIAGAAAIANATRRGRPLSVPEVDPDQVVVDFDEADHTPPVTFHIVYRNSHGVRSGRVITIRSIRREFNDVRIGAYCHERKAFRTFLASQIIEATDLSTGEVRADALTFFEHHALLGGISPDTRLSLETMALQECRDEVTILCIVAAADGHFDEAERDVIIRHVMNRCPDEGMQEHEIQRRIRNLAPDEHAYDSAVHRLRNGRGDTKALMSSLRKLIDADGIIEPEEAAFCARLEIDLELANS